MSTTPVTQQSDPYAEFGGSVTSAPTSATSATPASDPYAEFGGSITQNTQPPAGAGSYQAATNEQTPEGAAAALAQRQAEHPVLTAIGKGSEEALGDVWDAAKGAVKGAFTPLPVQAVAGMHDSIKQAIPAFQAYETARSSGKGIMDSLSAANEVAKQHNAAQQFLKERIDEFKKQPGAAAVRAVADAAAIAATIWDGGKLNPANTESGVTHTFTPEEGLQPANTKPGLIQQIIQGEKVAQPGAQAAIRQGVQAGAAGTADESMISNIQSKPLLQGNQTVLDEHMDALAKNESAAYKKMDETAGFDVKAEKAQLSNDQYKLKQLGNTDADVTQRGNLIESINDSTARIADAEAKMKAAGVDPRAADVIHRQRMAGVDFQKVLVKNTSADGASVNVDGLLKASKNLRFSRYGDRLEQFFGSPEAADDFMRDLQQAQETGAHALKVQNIAKMVGKYVAYTAGLGALGHVAIGHMLE